MSIPEKKYPDWWTINDAVLSKHALTQVEEDASKNPWKIEDSNGSLNYMFNVANRHNRCAKIEIKKGVEKDWKGMLVIANGAKHYSFTCASCGEFGKAMCLAMIKVILQWLSSYKEENQ